MATTWNPADKGASVTLSNANLTAVVAHPSANGVRSTASKASGKWYAEFTVGSSAGTAGTMDFVVGIADASWVNTGSTQLGADAHSVGYRSDGGIYGNSFTLLSSAASYAPGDVIGVAFDATGRTVTFYKNNVSQFTASGTGFPSGALFFGYAGDGAGNDAAATANFGATATTYTPPTGYSTIDTPALVDLTMTGGVTVAGVAAIFPSSSIVIAGGVTVGGVASVVFHVSLLLDLVGSGGATVGGSAAVEFTKATIYSIADDNEPAGGAVAGGAAVVQEHIPVVPAGGAVGGGAALVQDHLPFAPTGGAVGGGVALHAQVFSTAAPAGGGVAGGSAAVVFVAAVLPSGGAIAGGAAVVSDRQALYVPSGGAIAGGSALAYALAAGFVPTTENPYGDPFPGWAVNYESGAPSRYLGLPANSFAQLNGVTYCANAGGIYAIDAKSDAGQPIRAQVLLPTSDHGDVHNKRLPHIWVGAEMAAAMVMKIVTDNASASYYSVDPCDARMRASRVEPGKGIEGRYFQVGLANVAGADFTLESLELPFSILKRHGR